MADNFNSDTTNGWSGLRLALLALFSYETVSIHSGDSPSLLASTRWATYAYLGSISVRHVTAEGFLGTLCALLLATAFCVCDMQHDYAVAVYLIKTIGGNYLAALNFFNFDNKLFLLFTFGIAGPLLLLLERYAEVVASPYLRIFLILLSIQLFCEYGNLHCKKFKFFRHGYSFESLTFALLVLLPLTREEPTVVQLDLVACLFSRLGNFIIDFVKSGASTKACFLIFGYFCGIRLQNVTDPEVAMAVMNASDEKGDALERNVATPAWRPVINLESVDGVLYQTMLRNFHQIVKILPPTKNFNALAKAHCLALLESERPITADAIAKLSMEVFIEYVFGQPWHPEFTTFVTASWHWRREIAVRGKADPAIKCAAINLLIDKLIRPHPVLWNLFEDKWLQPMYYSLILQPFLISPCINLGDVAVSIKLNPGVSLETAMRTMHPFPVFERFVKDDVVVKGRVAIPANTQVIMFTKDFGSGPPLWPVFGSGPRRCPGAHLALPFLQEIAATLSTSPRFMPEEGHRYSGRNNDANFSVSELWYFVKTVVPLTLGLGRVDSINEK